MTGSTRMWILATTTFHFAVAASLSSCTPSRMNEEWSEGKFNRNQGVKPFPLLSQTTLESLRNDFQREPNGGAPLTIGLSLSGGGPRAAMFSHGVMQGLNDSKILDHVDAISSVSGGSYAALWYYTKRLETKKSGISDHNVVFTDCIPLWWQQEPKPGSERESTESLIHLALKQAGRGEDGFKPMYQCKFKMHFSFNESDTGLKYYSDPFRWQVHLGRWPDLFSNKETIATGDSQPAPFSSTMKYAFVALGEWIKAPFVETSKVSIAYQNGIERAWGLNPNPRTKWNQAFSYTNDTKNIGSSDWHLDSKTATWQLLQNLHEDKTSAKMPLWILNTSLTPSEKGKHNDPLFRDPSEIFEITPFGQGSTLTGYLSNDSRVINDLGTSVRVSGAALDTTSKIQPPASKLGISFNNPFQQQPKEIRLSDGGHTENLGIYSLLRRGARDVIIVDAEQDVEGRFEGLCIARDMLQKEGAIMRFDQSLINFDRICGDWKNNPGDPRHAYNISAWVNGVVPGNVFWPKNSGIPNTNLWLVKLGWDEAAVGRAFRAGKCESKEYPVSCMLTAYYGSNAGSVVRKDGHMYFPQLPTAGIAYNSSTYLFWAYRELGRTAVSGLQRNEDGTLSLKPGAALKAQPLLCEKPGVSAVSC